jgi:Tfp pilus assembly protein PilV
MLNNMKKGATLVGALVAIAILSITFVALLNLQIGIIRVEFDKQYDNTANLLMPEGLEIVRAIYQSNLNDTGAWNEGLADGTYVVDYNTDIKVGLSVTSDCDTAGLNDSCSLTQNSINGYTLNPSGNILYRYITIANDTDKITVTSTVIVRNLQLSRSKIYTADMELFDIMK